MNIVTLSRTTVIDNLYGVQPFVSAVRPGTWTSASFWTGTFGVPDSSQAVTVDIVQVAINDLTNLLQTTSYADMLSTAQSFFLDSAAQVLYINTGRKFSRLLDMFTQGRAYGYCDGQLIYIDDIEYLPVLQRVGSLEKSQDLKGYSKLSFQSGSVDFSNIAGELDFLDSEVVTGNEIRSYYLDDSSGKTQYSTSELVSISAGYVDDYKLSLEKASVNFMDKRRAGDIKIPVNTFADTGKPIPILYGKANIVEAYCTNPDATTTPPVFRFCETATVLGTVQVEASGTWTTRTPTATSLSTGSFTLSVADGRVSGRPLKCRVVGSTGVAITNSLDIIADLYFKYLQIPFSTSFFNTGEWATAKAGLSNAVGLYVNKQTDLYEVIRQLQAGDEKGFRFDVDRRGQFTARVDDPDRAESFYVHSEDIEDITRLEYETDTEPLAARVTVNYYRDNMSNDPLSVLDDSNADYVKDTYRLQPTQVYDSLLTTKTAAESRAAWESAKFRDVRKVVEFTAMGKDFLTIEIYDTGTVELSPCFVDADAAKIVGERCWLGVWKVQVLSIKPDPSGLKNTIRALLVEKQY